MRTVHSRIVSLTKGGVMDTPKEQGRGQTVINSPSTSYMEAKRLDVLCNSIRWGNAHFRPDAGLAFASDGRAYTIENVRYAAALLEATSEARDIQIDHKQAIRRANTVLEKLLAVPSPSVGRGIVIFRRFHASDAEPLLPFTLKQELLPILVFLEENRSRLKLSPHVGKAVEESLGSLVEQLPSHHLPTLDPASANSRQRNVPEVIAAFGPRFHWAYSVPDEFDMDLLKTPIPVWNVSTEECDQLEECKEVRCVVSSEFDTPENTSGEAPDAGPVKAAFFKGRGRIFQETTYPVIFVSGWQAQLVTISELWPPKVNFSCHPSGLGFSSDSSFSTKAPQSAPPPGEGKHDYPPPIVEVLPDLPDYHSYCGLEQLLKCFAAHDHVRWCQSQPGGDIQIAANELYAVVNRAKVLYSVDQVILVCHSRGGLVARQYVVDRWKREGVVDVAKMITYGTPHLGAELADIGEEIIVQELLANLGLAFWTAPLQLFGLIPGIGSEIVDEFQEHIIGVFASLVRPLWEGLYAFLTSGEQMKQSSDFIRNLNKDYQAKVIPSSSGLISLWDAIDHVLVAGTSPTFLTVYIGSWVSDFSNPAKALEPRVELRKKHVLGVTVYYPHVYWVFNWTWYPILSFLNDLVKTSVVLRQFDTINEGRGDGVVARTSALADGVTGKIRRAEFKLQHFNITSNSEETTIYDSPFGKRVVTPWQLMFLELGIEKFGLYTSCPCTDDLDCKH